jgi:uncharacterized membrane protein YdbT with pleckstrin-like domain
MPNEQILLKSRITPFILIFPVFLLFIAILLTISSLSTSNGQSTSSSAPASMFFCFAGPILLYSILLFLSQLVRFLTTEFAVTNRRIIAKTGFIRRNSLDLRLPKVESVEVKQGIGGRIFSYGTITVVGTGGTHQGFKGIADPVGTKKKINQIIETYSSQVENIMN